MQQWGFGKRLPRVSGCCPTRNIPLPMVSGGLGHLPRGGRRVCGRFRLCWEEGLVRAKCKPREEVCTTSSGPLWWTQLPTCPLCPCPAPLCSLHPRYSPDCAPLSGPCPRNMGESHWFPHPASWSPSLNSLPCVQVPLPCLDSSDSQSGHPKSTPLRNVGPCSTMSSGKLLSLCVVPFLICKMGIRSLLDRVIIRV